MTRRKPSLIAAGVCHEHNLARLPADPMDAGGRSAHLPGFPPNRIRSYPSPGTATEADVLEAEARSGRICELIDGTLVEKVMASLESGLAVELAYFIRRYLEANDLGTLLAGDGYLKILPRRFAPRMSRSSAGNVSSGENRPKRPSTPLLPIWPSRSCPKETRRRRWIASCANISWQACDWCGTSSPRPAPAGLHGRRCVDGDRSERFARGRRRVARLQTAACPVVRPGGRAAAGIGNVCWSPGFSR